MFVLSYLQRSINSELSEKLCFSAARFYRQADGELTRARDTAKHNAIGIRECMQPAARAVRSCEVSRRNVARRVPIHVETLPTCRSPTTSCAW